MVKYLLKNCDKDKDIKVIITFIYVSLWTDVCSKRWATLHNGKAFTVISDTKIRIEAITRSVLYKKLFLKISLYSQENICVGDSF